MPSDVRALVGSAQRAPSATAREAYRSMFWDSDGLYADV
jgi:hypothetical protein